MPEMTLLDIGGGFTFVHSDNKRNFNVVAPQVNELLVQHFPDLKVRIIGEPGRFVSESVVYMATPIIGKRVLKNGSRHYYLNAGVYQGYPLRTFGEEQFVSPLDRSVESRTKYPTTFWGQTCDSCDWVLKD
mmetsp:Transcript_18414/g.31492  ORF Transcript_18414/g.31492 Transcript_18414/m.31492 type:complete len:131 (-) Transcript_18414:243-635(-)